MVGKKVYRSSQGKSIDLGALLLQNETVRAVGNMGVNARGDKIDSVNDVIQGRNDQMAQHYKKTYNKHVKDQPVYKSIAEAEAALNASAVQETAPTKTVEAAPAVEQPATATPVVEEPVAQKVPTSGLAGAIAKARSVEQEEEKTARQLEQEKSGVKRI